jgi:hypothetical protein
MDGRRHRALQWTIANEPQRITSMFSLTELLYLGDGPVAALNPWGSSAMGWSGCLCTRLAPPRLWRLLSGRPQLGLMAATVPDLNLHVAMMLRELHLPAAVAKIVLEAATQDFIDEVRPTDFNDWLIRSARETRGSEQTRWLPSPLPGCRGWTRAARRSTMITIQRCGVLGAS